jgi:hypothetical protein
LTGDAVQWTLAAVLLLGAIGATVVALVSVVSSATVAIAVPFINSLLERRRLRQQSLNARLDEVRRLLDSAVQHLFKGYWVLFDIHEERRKDPGSSDWSPAKLRRLADRLTQETETCASHGIRMDLRMPSGSALTKRLREANRVFLAYEPRYRAYIDRNLVEKERPPEPPHGKAFDLIKALQDEIRRFAGVVTPSTPSVRPSDVRRLLHLRARED